MYFIFFSWISRLDNMEEFGGTTASYYFIIVTLKMVPKRGITPIQQGDDLDSTYYPLYGIYLIFYCFKTKSVCIILKNDFFIQFTVYFKSYRWKIILRNIWKILFLYTLKIFSDKTKKKKRSFWRLPFLFLCIKLKIILNITIHFFKTDKNV